jgi:membrane peptidoglycan carboxypeptidase
VAREFLDHIRVVVNQSPQAHVTVQYALNNSGNPALVALSSMLGILHSDRLAADYDLVKSAQEQPAQAAGALALATDVIDQLDRLAAGTAGVPFDPVAAAAAILNWATVTGKTNVKRK